MGELELIMNKSGVEEELTTSLKKKISLLQKDDESFRLNVEDNGSVENSDNLWIYEDNNNVINNETSSFFANSVHFFKS